MSERASNRRSAMLALHLWLQLTVGPAERDPFMVPRWPNFLGNVNPDRTWRPRPMKHRYRRHRCLPMAGAAFVRPA